MDCSRLNTESDICLSIVVPVYNVGRYLGRCIDSLLLAEGIGKTEIIIVDDGSADDSGKIADSYSDRYEFITCYHKENGGLSDARNYGLNLASGKYVFFCDSDDMVIPKAMGKLIEEAAQSSAELIMFDGLTIGEDDNVTDRGYGMILGHSGVDAAKEDSGLQMMISQIKDHGRFAMTAWLLACRRDYLIDNGLFFEPGLIHEDELWTPKVLTGAPKVKYLQEKVYCYRIRNNSIMNGPSDDTEKHAKSLVYVMNSLYVYYAGNIRDKVNRKTMRSHWAGQYLWILSAYDVHRFECRKEVPRSEILKCASGIKAKIKCIILLVFGTKTYCKLFGAR